MKYRLLKDIRNIVSGAVFEETAMNMFETDGYGYLIPKELVENNPTWFAPIDERWKPEMDGNYWIIGDNIDVYEELYQNDNIDKERFVSCNFFKTEAEARSAALKVKELLLSLHKENE